jgi:hypothetical protein
MAGPPAFIAYTREAPAGIPPELEEVDDELEDDELLEDELEELELLEELLEEELVDEELLEELEDELLGSVVVPLHAVSDAVSVKPKRILCQFMALISRMTLPIK